MFDILFSVDYDRIYDEVYGIDIASKVLTDLNKKPSKSDLVNFLLAYYGTELLDQKSIRLLLIDSLENNQINQLCQELNISPENHKHDAALKIAVMGWNKNSGLPEKLNKILAYSIPVEYLPFGVDRVILPKIEKVYAIKRQKLFNYQKEISSKIYLLSKKRKS